MTIGYDNGMSIVCSVTEPMKNIDIFLLIKLFHNIFTPFGAWIILADVILGFLCAALFVFLMMAAGRRTCDGRDPEDDDPQTANRGVNGDGRDFWEKAKDSNRAQRREPQAMIMEAGPVACRQAERLL